MKKCIILAVSLLLLYSCTKENALEFTITKTTLDAIPALKIQLNCKADPSGRTTLLFQNKAWGEDSLHNVLRNIRSLQEGIKISRHKDSGHIYLQHARDLDNIQLEYYIVQDTKLPITTAKAFRPIVQEDYFYGFSHNLFMLPRNYASTQDAKFDVVLHWKEFPKKANLVNSFGTNEKEQVLKATDQDHFHSAVFAGGDYRAHKIDVKGNTAVLGIRGDWEVFADSTLISMLQSTLYAQRNFWQDHSQKYFAVTVTPTFLERGSGFQGTGLTNSFATSVTNNNYLDFHGLVYLFNHELQHNWTGTIIKNANEESQYWFSEGFTEYYTFKNIARNHISGLDTGYFIKELNSLIKKLYTSPVKEAPNSEINYKNFWSSREYEKLPYRRGAIFAFYLDNRIRKDSRNTKSLDDLMLAIKEDAINHQQKIDHTYFLKKANQYVEKDLTPFFNAHIVEGKLFDLKAIFEEFDYDYQEKSKVFDLGITLSADKKYIVDVDEHSNAYKAGLRKGDRLTLRSYYYGNPEFEAEFGVYKNGKETMHKYFPADEAAIPSLKDSERNKKAVS